MPLCTVFKGIFRSGLTTFYALQCVACFLYPNPAFSPLARATQGCNSRVFRATLRPRPQDQHTRSLNGNSFKRKRNPDARPATMASPSLPAAASGPGAEHGHSSGTSNSMPPRGGSIVDGLKDIGERFWTGGFGTCFTGNYANVDTEVREASGSGKAGDGRVYKEYAIKMALTLVDQDPRQVLHPHVIPARFSVGFASTYLVPSCDRVQGVDTYQSEPLCYLLLPAGFKCPQQCLAVDNQTPNTRTAVSCQETLLLPTRRFPRLTRRSEIWKRRSTYSSVGASLRTPISCAAFTASRCVLFTDVSPQKCLPWSQIWYLTPCAYSQAPTYEISPPCDNGLFSFV